jgi:hypothetical protein
LAMLLLGFLQEVDTSEFKTTHARTLRLATPQWLQDSKLQTLSHITFKLTEKLLKFKMFQVPGSKIIHFQLSSVKPQNSNRNRTLCRNRLGFW